MRYKNPTPNPLQYQKLILFFPPLRGRAVSRIIKQEIKRVKLT
jgi:hypothetical protein